MRAASNFELMYGQFLGEENTKHNAAAAAAALATDKQKEQRISALLCSLHTQLSYSCSRAKTYSLAQVTTMSSRLVARMLPQRRHQVMECCKPSTLKFWSAQVPRGSVKANEKRKASRLMPPLRAKISTLATHKTTLRLKCFQSV